MARGNVAEKTGIYGYHIGRTLKLHGPSRFFESEHAAQAWARSCSAPQSVILLALDEGDCIRWLDSDVIRLASRYAVRH